MFPELSEGHLDAYRQAIVQNQHLAELAVRLGIHKYLLYTHSVDFCYDSTFIYARSDAFEALMAAITLDAGLDTVDRIFGAVLFGDDERIHRVWVQIPPHPLQSQCPEGDRSWATKVPMLRKLCTLEDILGIKFKHLRVLARALTIRKTGFNVYTLGDNQRLEFLGDSLLKYVSTDYLFRHFPRHHEGHLSLLKNSLVNKYTQASVCSELGLEHYVIRREDNSIHKCNNINNTTAATTSKNPNSCKVANTTQVSSSNPSVPKSRRNKKGSQKQVNNSEANKNNSCNPQNQNVKYRADLLEAFIGALFVDKDLTWVERFCQICFWPRLVEFILKQEWNDAKSKLQQCCLTFRSLNEDPEIAHYKVLEHSGPTNQRVYRVGVYFRGQRLATGQGRSVQQAQMEAAKKALELHQDTFRQLDFQRSVISKRYKQPYINKILDQVQNWDEELVEYFISDKPSSTLAMSTLTTTVTTSTLTMTTPIIDSNISNKDNNNISVIHHQDDPDEELLHKCNNKRRCIDHTVNQNVCANEKMSSIPIVSSASSSSLERFSSVCKLPQTSTTTMSLNDNDNIIVDSEALEDMRLEEDEGKNELKSVLSDNNGVENDGDEEEEEGEIVEDDDDDDYYDELSSDDNQTHCKFTYFNDNRKRS